tara:strand:- start:528 stop:1187 length:660 start_codon:yes stop_codon:yes gene_type:complete
VKFLQINYLLIISVLPLLGCQISNKSTTQIDNKSYINEFELLQENSNNQTSVRISSPRAILDPINNDIEIFKSKIEILNEIGKDFKVESGNSRLNNISNVIRVYNDVSISFLDNDDSYITTDSFEWDLNTSVIDINNPLNINFDNTKIYASNGFYNIKSSLLKIDNTELNRNINSPEGDIKYQLRLISDFAKWYKNENTLVFTSNDKQVETTINVLLTK